MDFVIVTAAIVTERLSLTTGPGMMTLGDVRKAIEARWKLPPYLQRITCREREYKNHPNSIPITEVLKGTEKDVQQGGQRVIFLNWMGDDDYCEISDDFEFFPAEEFDRTKKQRKRSGEEFLAVTLEAYRRIAEDVVKQYRAHQLGTDESSDVGDEGNGDNPPNGPGGCDGNGSGKKRKAPSSASKPHR